MRRLWLKFLLWRAHYCTVHLRHKTYRFGAGGGWYVCPDCQKSSYEEWRERLRLMRQEYQDLNANR